MTIVSALERPAVCIVTGAAGFIGSHLCRALLGQGHRVVGVDNFDTFYEPALKRRNIEQLDQQYGAAFAWELVEADIRSAPAMSGLMERVRPDVVFHLAALAGVRPSIANPARYVSVNIDGLVTALEAARAAACCRFIFASSSSVYGNTPKVPFAEDDPVDRPISPYGATKRAGELICQTYARLFDMRIAALRFFTVYGPAQRPDLAIAKFMRLIAAGEEVPMFGDGGTSRDYTYIDDIIQGMLAAADAVRASSSSFFRIWNLGSDNPVSLTDMIDSIAMVVGKPARIRPLPMQVGDVERTWADLKRSGDELGYRPRTTFARGLAEQWSEYSRAKSRNGY